MNIRAKTAAPDGGIDKSALSMRATLQAAAATEASAAAAHAAVL